MPARRVRVAREREPRRRRSPSVLGDEDGGVRMAPHRLQVAALVRDRAPASRRQRSSAPSSRGDRLGRARRGPARRAGSARRTAITRPRRRRRRAAGRPRPRAPSAARCDGLHAAEEEVEPVPAHDVPRCRRGGARRRPPSRLRDAAWRRRHGSAARRSPRRRGSPREDAPRRPARSRRRAAPSPALPSDERGAARRRARASASSCSAAARPARASSAPITSSSPSMLLSCVPPRKTPEPEPRVDESAAAVPVASTTETCVVPVSGPCAERSVGERRPPRASSCERRGRPPPRASSGSRARSRRRARAAESQHALSRWSRLERRALDDPVGGEIVRELGEELGDGRGARVADPLERRARDRP